MPSVSEVRAGAQRVSSPRAPSGGSSGFSLPPAGQAAAGPTAAPSVLAVPAGLWRFRRLAWRRRRTTRPSGRGHDLLAGLRALQRALLARACSQTEPLGDLASHAHEGCAGGGGSATAGGSVDALVQRARRTGPVGTVKGGGCDESVSCQPLEPCA
jgi:hypothetical protein